jgi:hypothetical protein
MAVLQVCVRVPGWMQLDPSMEASARVILGLHPPFTAHMCTPTCAAATLLQCPRMQREPNSMQTYAEPAVGLH